MRENSWFSVSDLGARASDLRAMGLRIRDFRASFSDSTSIVQGFVWTQMSGSGKVLHRSPGEHAIRIPLLNKITHVSLDTENGNCLAVVSTV